VFAEAVLVVVVQRQQIRREGLVALTSHSLVDLAGVLSTQRVDTLVCGGVSRESREFLGAHRIEIVDNVAGTIEEVLAAIQHGVLRSGFGLDGQTVPLAPDAAMAASEQVGAAGLVEDGAPATVKEPEVDCLACMARACLRGAACPLTSIAASGPGADRVTGLMLEASLDIAVEPERTLCRLSELIYFCLEMRYRRIGVAFCEDLREPAEILVRVLRRFFDVYPVSCKLGERPMSTLAARVARVDRSDSVLQSKGQARCSTVSTRT
jgi:uncharacterized metal-binding protein/predicted Fe-Mo cluster-binding NifX family protein